MAVERHAGGPHLGGEPADGERLDFVAGTLLCGLGAAAGSFPLTLAGRAVAGLSGGVFPLAFGMARAAPPPARLPGVVAVLSAMFGIGGALGMVLSGPLADWFGTPWLFWPLLVPGLAALALVAALPATARPPGGRVDLAGAVLLAGALVCLLLPIAAAMLLASPLSALLRARFAARTPYFWGRCAPPRRSVRWPWRTSGSGSSASSGCSRAPPTASASPRWETWSWTRSSRGTPGRPAA
jgi:MFS family permease